MSSGRRCSASPTTSPRDRPGVRPELAERLVAALNDGETPPRPRDRVGRLRRTSRRSRSSPSRSFGATSTLEPGEGTALLDNNAFSTGWAALAIADAATLLDAMDVAGAVSLDGFAANPTMIHPAIGEVRPYPGIVATLARLGGAARGQRDPRAGRRRATSRTR